MGSPRAWQSGKKKTSKSNTSVYPIITLPSAGFFCFLVDDLPKLRYNTHMNKTNETIQWVGTAFILTMYVVSNFFPGYDNLRNAVALAGGLCFFTWSYRVANKPQMIINGVAVVLCVVGLFKGLA